MSETYYPCPCCGNLVFSELHAFEICPICNWEDDNVQFEDANYIGGANQKSLNTCRKLWKEQVNLKHPNNFKKL